MSGGVFGDEIAEIVVFWGFFAFSRNSKSSPQMYNMFAGAESCFRSLFLIFNIQRTNKQPTPTGRGAGQSAWSFFCFVYFFSFFLCSQSTCAQTHALARMLSQEDDEYPTWMDWIKNNCNETVLIVVIHQAVQRWTPEADRYESVWLLNSV